MSTSSIAATTNCGGVTAFAKRARRHLCVTSPQDEDVDFIAPTYFTLFHSIWPAQIGLKRTEGHAMPLDLFSRKLLLLVEDEPLIALDVELQLRKAGARVITAGVSRQPPCL